MPVTVPPVTAAWPVVLVHEPPAEASVSMIVEVAQTVEVEPDIVPASGNGFTVTGKVTDVEPQALVTV